MVLRERVWVDCNVQGVLIGRVVLYWISALLYVGLGSACFQYYQHPDWTLFSHAKVLFSQFWPWLPSAILCLPLVIFDVVRLSNCFAGPIYRLRKHLDELNDDPNCRPLSFRDGDYWQDLTEPMHCLQDELLMLRAELVRLRNLTGGARSGPPLDPKVAATTPLKLSQVEMERAKNPLPPMGASFDPASTSV
ncbi:MAG: hypothetical protein R3C09_05015 [Pirellulaceae bacterium]